MRKFVLAVAILFGGLATLVVPASAASAKPIKQQISGSYSGTGTFTFAATATCPNAVETVFDAAYTAKSGGTGSFHLDGCVNPVGTSPFAYSGTSTLTTPGGTVLTGTVTGGIGATDGSLDLTLSLSGAGGTTTTVHLTGVWASDGVTGGPISGTLSGK